MYTVNKVLVSSGRITRTLDVTAERVKDLLSKYTSIRVVLSNPTLDVLVVGELQDNQFVADYPGTIANLVLTNEITRLNLTPYIDVQQALCVYKTDLWDREYDIEPHNLFDVNDEDDPTTWPDLKLVNGFVDPRLMAETHLVSVNGLVHPLVSDEHGVYVVGGNVNVRATDKMEMSLLEFRDVGKITYHSLSCNTRVKVHETDDLFSNGIYTKLDPSYRDKVLGMVLLGHLHLLDGTYTHFDDDIIHIDLKHLDLETKIINHYAALGMDTVGDYLGGTLGRVDLRNPSLIDYILNNKSTFLFTLDTDRLYRHERPLHDEGLPCVYSTPLGVQGIAQYADGLLADYRQEYQDGLYCIQVPTRAQSNLIMKTTNYAQQGAGVRGHLPTKHDSQPLLTAVDFSRKA